jgi:hypothetical protein
VRGSTGPATAEHRSAASLLGALNAAHASPTARAHAAPESRVGRIAAYESAMRAALSLPAFTVEQIAVRDAAIASARSTQLTAAANRSVTPDVVARVDRLLGLPPSDPWLGVGTWR